MSWIKSHARGSFALYAGNVIAAFQPLDFYHFFPLWYEKWVERMARAIRVLELETKKYHEIRHLLPCPSGIRGVLTKIIPAYLGSERKNPGDFQTVANFLATMLQQACPDDPFAQRANPFHSPQQIEELMSTVFWQPATPNTARAQGRLVAAAGSLMHGLYNDVVTDYAWDGYGPYKVQYQGEEYTLLIRHFPDMQPRELWPVSVMPKCKEIVIYSLYQEVEWEIAALGCHTVTKSGNPVEGMRYHAVMIDGQAVSNERLDNLIAQLAEKAEKVYRKIRTLDDVSLKQKVMLQECYPLKNMLKQAGIEWRPTSDMLHACRQPLKSNFIPCDELIDSIERYEELLGLRVFAEEVLGEPAYRLG